MRIGTSILLIAVGAILRFAVSVSTSGFNIHTIGLILMIAGIVGALLSILWMALWADRQDRVRAPAQTTTYVEREREVPVRDRY